MIKSRHDPQVTEALVSKVAARTWNGYGNAFRHWCTHCSYRGFCPLMPAEDAEIADAISKNPSLEGGGLTAVLKKLREAALGFEDVTAALKLHQSRKKPGKSLAMRGEALSLTTLIDGVEKWKASGANEIRNRAIVLLKIDTFSRSADLTGLFMEQVSITPAGARMRFWDKTSRRRGKWSKAIFITRLDVPSMPAAVRRTCTVTALEHWIGVRSHFFPEDDETRALATSDAPEKMHALFINTRGGEKSGMPLADTTYAAIVKKFFAKIGVTSTEDGSGTDPTPHSTRGVIASDAIVAGARREEVVAHGRWDTMKAFDDHYWVRGGVPVWPCKQKHAPTVHFVRREWAWHKTGSDVIDGDQSDLPVFLCGNKPAEAKPRAIRTGVTAPAPASGGAEAAEQQPCSEHTSARRDDDDQERVKLPNSAELGGVNRPAEPQEAPTAPESTAQEATSSPRAKAWNEATEASPEATK